MGGVCLVFLPGYDGGREERRGKGCFPATDDGGRKEKGKKGCFLFGMWVSSLYIVSTLSICIYLPYFSHYFCQGHSSLDAPSELNPPQRIPSPLTALLVPQAEG